MVATDKARQSEISVVTPTLYRAREVALLLENLSQQTLLPQEVIIVDGAPAENTETEAAVARIADTLPFRCRYIKHAKGTAIQRNRGIAEACGEFIAFIDDDIHLEPDFFEAVVAVYSSDREKKIGGIVGYRTNRHFNSEDALRWKLYRHLRLLKTFEPGKYDFECGYPINANLQPPFNGVREVDFMTTSCAVWRKEVFASGLRFDPFFCDYGVLEDAHLSLRAGRNWQLLQCGDAHCKEMHSPNGRVNRQKIGYKCVVNYYYVFKDIVGPLTLKHKLRFWRYQMFELFRIATSAVRRMRSADLAELRGRIEGFVSVVRGSAF